MHSCIFSFYISETEVSLSELPLKHSVGEYIIYTDERTPFAHASLSERYCALFGYAIDVIDGESVSIPEKILSRSVNVNDVIEYEKRLGGKYIILYNDGTGIYLIGDATCSIPIYYGAVNDDFVCSSNPCYIVKEFSLTPDTVLQKIRNSGDVSQAMPYDITEYKEMKQLIPNHYLSFSERKAVRFVNAYVNQKNVTVNNATKIVLPMIERLAKYYSEIFNLYCPITSGRDSRVALAFLSSISEEPVKAYTIKHKEHNGNEQDLTVPEMLADVCAMNYDQIFDASLSEEFKNNIDCLLGDGKYSQRTLIIAKTVQEHCSDGAIINGDIIGQVGKCSLHRDIPSFLATAGYFRCKLHNYSKESKKYLKSWLNEIKSEGEKVNTFDLFSVENRLGRWAGQENLVYNSIGQLYLNVFNSRSIIYAWTAVSRRKRKKSLLHFELIRETSSSLLKIPFERDESSLIKISKANGLFYYISSFLKYRIERRRFMKEKK